MTVQIIKGHIVDAPAFGELKITENGYLILENGKISNVLTELPEAYADASVTDYGDRLVMPSFSDMHMHAPQYAMLGMGMDLPLLDWLNTYTFKTEAAFKDTGYAREVYRALAREMVDNGTTRVCAFSSLHRESTMVLMEEFEKAGMTGCVGKVNMDRNSGDILTETTEESMRETMTWLDESSGKFEHIKPILTPRFTPTCTNELMAFLGKLAQERNLPVQSHLSENTSEIAWVKELHPDCAQYWESYDKYGLFNDRTVMAHCVHSDERERKAMKEKGVWIAHCPDSNINLISGVAPVRVMMNEGLRVTLGSDIAGGALLAMPQVVTSAIRASKMKRIQTNWTDEFLTVAEAFYLGTTAGAKFFGAAGGFAKGDGLHAVVVDDAAFPKPAKELSVKERFERALYLMTKRDIVAVYSDGRKVK
ncbi:MAG: amidohydrolase family protein [Alphaproteobacteria bacterium]|nr:amidohydrolase family protein [Alphaproteobacteria bacterium]